MSYSDRATLDLMLWEGTKTFKDGINILKARILSKDLKAKSLVRLWL